MIKNRFLLYLPLGLTVILFLLGTFFDLNIASSFGVHSDFFTIFGAIFLPLIACSAMSFLAAFLFSHSLKHFEKASKKIIFISISVVMFIFATFIAQKEIISHDGLNIKHGYYISIPIALVFDVGVGFFGYRAGKRNENRDIHKLIIFIFACIAFAIAATLLLKNVIHRIRYVALVDGTFTIEDYCPWFEGSSLYEGYSGDKWVFQSFPSGHTSIVMSLSLTAPFIANCYERSRRHINLWYSIAILLSYIMVISRLYSGSHFLSDTMLPGLLIYLPFTIGYEFYFSKFRINPVESRDF